MSISFEAVTTDQQFRDLLLVRNECRDGLTHYTREISLKEQVAWKDLCWAVGLRSAPRYEPYLLYEDGWPVAYGMLKWDGLKYWMTVGVAKDSRRRGLGKLVTNLITEIGHRDGKEVWLDVMDDNPMLPTYLKAGYEFRETVMFGDNDLHIMEHKREQNIQPKELFWLQNHQKLQS
jgi:ribosomal protein S18 acetylase RimI-like enzyme